MAIEILMPALSPTMEEGKLAKWLVKEGDAITAGMVMAEIETDKATMEVEAVDEGTMGRILIAEGTEGVKVNAPIALLLEEGEDASALTTAAQPSQPDAPPPQPAAAPAPEPAPPQPSSATPIPQPPAAQAPTATTPTATNGATPSRIFASPLARRLAADKGIDLAALQGSGPYGRIVKRDIEAAQSAPTQDTAKPPAPASTALTPQQPRSQPVGGAVIEAMPDDKILALYDEGTYEVVPHDGMRKVIAQRLTQSKQTIPHFYLSVDCVLDELLRARARMNDAAPKEGALAYKLSVNDFVIKALALALQRVPGANATWTDGGTLRHRHSDVGVAVAVEGGLFTPVIRHAELKTLGEISNEIKDLASRARNRRLAPHEYQGGTTSISNLGMYGIKSFDAVINPPHATILAVGAGEKRPLVVGDGITIATLMTCTMSCDHRVVDGALAAELLNAFKEFIEDPVRMLV